MQGRALHPLRPTNASCAYGQLLLAVAPTYVWLSQRKLNQAAAAFADGDCRSATDAALSSTSILGIRPEAYKVVSYCDIRRGMPDLAIALIEKAASLDPQNWNYEYDLSIMRAAAGLDPRPAAQKALALDPHESFTRDAWQLFRNGNPTKWQAEGRRLAYQFTSL